jgi:hypothetical protein
MIFIEQDTPLSRQQIQSYIQTLRDAATAWDRGDGVPARQLLKELVPSFYDPEELNCTAETAREMQQVH